MFVPEGFGTVTPYFFVNEAEKFVEYLVSGLGGKERGRSLRPDGRIANAQIRLGSSTVMVSEASEAFPAMPGSFYLYVENADDSVEEAVKAGGELIMPVADMPYEDRQGGVRDPFGNIWWISQRLVGRPYDE
jgi:PhnB protein